MRKLGLLCLLLMTPVLSQAQSKNDSWDALRNLRVGEKIDVVETSMKKDTGTFAMVSDESIQIREGANEIGIRKENVARVSLLDKGHRLRNALIFAAVGGGAGAGIGAAAAGSHAFLGRGPTTAFGAAIGLIGGAAIGAALPSHPTVYHAEPAKPSPPH
jgi:hypothetical protein